MNQSKNKRSKLTRSEKLLDQIQSGKIQDDDSVGHPGKFPGFQLSSDFRLFKKREIVKPYLHPYDSREINKQIREGIQADTEKLDKILPTHLMNDVYSLYYNSTERMTFEGLDSTNKVKFGILDSINNSLIKIVTNNSHISSYVYTEEIGKFLYKKFSEMTPEQQKELQKALEGSNQGGDDKNQKSQASLGGKQAGKPDPNAPKAEGEAPAPPDEDMFDQQSNDSKPEEESKRNEGNSHTGAANNSFGNNSKKDMSQEAADKMAKDLENMLNSKQSKRELEKAFKNAEEKLDKLKQIGVDTESNQELPEEEQKEIVRNLNNLDNIKRSLSSLNTSKDKVLKAVDKILSNTSNYFSQRCITSEVEIFEADEIIDINGIELLHPAFRNAMLFDMSVTQRKFIGKFDLYVDCSGSMGSGCGGELNGVCRIDLAKSLAMQMKQLGILGELYEFEDVPRRILNTEISILMMDARGGTNLDTVLRKILETGNNSVILTDGESSISHYTHKALFIGVGTDFRYFKNGSEGSHGKMFVDQGQCIMYNGKDFVTA